MSHKSYSKMRQTLDSFQKDYCKNQNKTDIDDDDPQTPSKTLSYNTSNSNQMTSSSMKPILKQTTSRKKNKKSQISDDSYSKKNAHFKKPLKEIYVVENYKEYNIDVSEEGSSWFCGFSCFFQKKKILK